jgi:hypothetical protein
MESLWGSLGDTIRGYITVPLVQGEGYHMTMSHTCHFISWTVPSHWMYILSSGVIVIMKKTPHLMSLIKLHNISSKLILHTRYKNRTNLSILIKSTHICTKLRLIRSQTIIIIYKELLLHIICRLLWNHSLSGSHGRRWARKLTHQKPPKLKTTHVGVVIGHHSGPQKGQSLHYFFT